MLDSGSRHIHAAHRAHQHFRNGLFFHHHLIRAGTNGRQTGGDEVAAADDAQIRVEQPRDSGGIDRGSLVRNGHHQHRSLADVSPPEQGFLAAIAFNHVQVGVVLTTMHRRGIALQHQHFATGIADQVGRRPARNAKTCDDDMPTKGYLTR